MRRLIILTLVLITTLSTMAADYSKFDRELYAGQSCTLVLESGANPKVGLFALMGDAKAPRWAIFKNFVLN